MPAPELGKLESVHGIARLYTRRIFVIVAICLVVFSIGTFLVVNEIQRGSRDYFGNAVGYFVCGIVPFALICIAIWSWLRKRKAELRLYENGFTFLIDGKMQVCLWDEIQNVFLEEKAIFSPKNKTFVCNVQKRNGEDIIFTEAVQDVENIHKFIEKKLTEG